VGVQLEVGEGSFYGLTKPRQVPPNLEQMEGILVDLDAPDRDGTVHFLEVLLALLQRLTGVVHEEQIMAKLMHMHPKYLDSIKKMKRVTGSTSDKFTKASIMMHLKRGLAANGLLAEFENRNKAGSSTEQPSDGSFLKKCTGTFDMSFLGRRSAAAEKGHTERELSRQRELKRATLSRSAIEPAALDPYTA
jgi:hypothetical protein